MSSVVSETSPFWSVHRCYSLSEQPYRAPQHSGPCFMYEEDANIAGGAYGSEMEPRSAKGFSNTLKQKSLCLYLNIKLQESTIQICHIDLTTLISRYDCTVNCLNSKNFSIISSLIRSVTNSVFWDVTPCGSCKKRRFGET
jgi:hypothetical protein